MDQSTGSNFLTGGSTSTGSAVVAEVFAHSAGTLYKLDPNTKAVTTVGNFTGCNSEVIDIALNKSSEMYATCFNGLYRIDKTTAACTLIQEGGYPNSLSFVPAGTLDPNKEALVGYNGETYVRINETNGQVQELGSIGSSLSSSGDIVSVIGGPTYLTVKGPGCSDCLIEVNPSTGGLVKNWGSLGYFNVYGIAFWGGSVYGFNEGGNLFEVKFDNGVLSTSLVPNAGPAYYGAGSTTAAPTGPS